MKKITYVAQMDIGGNWVDDFVEDSKSRFEQRLEFRKTIHPNRQFRKLRRTTTPKWSYETLWESIHGKGSWSLNPYVFAYTFVKL